MMISREELRDSARKGLGSDGLMPPADHSWERLVEMGWFAMAVPEHHGGLGLGPEALAAVHIELGRALVPGPAIAQMLAIDVLCSVPDFATRDELLGATIGGRRLGLSLALHQAGTLTCVPDADQASQMLVLAPDHIALADITSANQNATWDETRRLFDVEIAGQTVIATGADAHDAYIRALSRLLLALSADAVGGADAVLDMSIEYLKTRRQFDRPLALFQALKHRVADMKIAVVAAEALLWSRTGDAVSLHDLATLKALATTSFCRIAEEAVQLHGGIGLTVEHPCHRFLKRAYLNAALGGDADHWNGFAGRVALGQQKSN